MCITIIESARYASQWELDRERERVEKSIITGDNNYCEHVEMTNEPAVAGPAEKMLSVMKEVTARKGQLPVRLFIVME